MKLFNRLFGPTEQRSTTTDGEFMRSLMGAPTSSGVSVSSESAMSSTAVLAAIRVLSESIASLPLIVYKRSGRAKVRAPEHPLYRVLHDLANPEMTAFSLRRLQVQHMAQYGNAYCEIEWSQSGKIVALYPLHPSRVGVEREKATGAIQYTYWSDKSGGVVLPAYRVFHLRWLESDGVVGQSPIKLAANAVGLGLAMERYGASFFANGARPSVILTHPEVLSDEAYLKLRARFSDAWSGLSNAHRIQILEEGMKVDTVGIAPQEAQLLEARKFQVNEIARIFRVPPHLIGDLDRATFSNIEHQNIEFLQYTLTPMLVGIEQEIRRQLMTPQELTTFDVEHKVDGLLRGDSTTRYEVYTKAITNGIMSPNEVRELENLNPVDGGDSYYMPMNLSPLGATPQPQPASDNQRSAATCTCGLDHGDEERAVPQLVDKRAEGDEIQKLGDSRRRLINSYLGIYQDVAQRHVRREVNDLRRAVDKYLRKRSASDFTAYLDEFYGDLATALPDLYRAVMDTYSKQVAAAVANEINGDEDKLLAEVREFIDGYLDNFARGYTAGNRNQLVALVEEAQAEGNDPADVVDQRLGEWEEKEANKTALKEVFEAGNALAVYYYGRGGVKYLRWVASGKSCPYCNSLNGKVVGIEDVFVDDGGSIEVEGMAPMLVRRRSRHAPLHSSCDCCTVAG